MQIYKISQNVNNKLQTYSAAVVVAAGRDRARYIHPSGFQDNYDVADGKMKPWFKIEKPLFNDWCKPEEVKVTYIGETDRFKNEGVIMADYCGKTSLEDLGMEINVNNELINEIDNYYLDIEYTGHGDN